MLKYFLSHQHSLDLRDLGYREISLGYYGKYHDYQEIKFYLGFCFKNNDPNGVLEAVDAPIYDQAFEFIRNKFKLTHEIACGKGQYFFRIGQVESFPFYLGCNDRQYYESYEQAQKACLEKLIEFAKSNNNIDGNENSKQDNL